MASYTLGGSGKKKKTEDEKKYNPVAGYRANGNSSTGKERQIKWNAMKAANVIRESDEDDWNYKFTNPGGLGKYTKRDEDHSNINPSPYNPDFRGDKSHRNTKPSAKRYNPVEGLRTENIKKKRTTGNRPKK